MGRSRESYPDGSAKTMTTRASAGFVRHSCRRRRRQAFDDQRKAGLRRPKSDRVPRSLCHAITNFYRVGEAKREDN
jgi:hypothetical protein